MSKLNKSVRFLVLNRTNQAVRALDENIPGMDAATLKARGEIAKKISPSFKNKGTAEKFGAALASKYPGERFYLAQIVAGCVVEPATGPWVATGATVADEHMADDVDLDSDDTDDNE
jgi:hypothetical protein